MALQMLSNTSELSLDSASTLMLLLDYLPSNSIVFSELAWGNIKDVLLLLLMVFVVYYYFLQLQSSKLTKRQQRLHNYVLTMYWSAAIKQTDIIHRKKVVEQYLILFIFFLL